MKIINNYCEIAIEKLIVHINACQKEKIFLHLSLLINKLAWTAEITDIFTKQLERVNNKTLIEGLGIRSISHSDSEVNDAGRGRTMQAGQGTI